MGLPDGGFLGWSFQSYAYSGTRILREVTGRSLGQYGNSTPWSYSFSHDDSANPNATVHSTTTLDDASGAEKVWTFATSNTQTPGWQTGLATQLQNRGSVGGASLRTDAFTWATGPGDGNPYISTTTKTYNPGASFQAAMKVSQTVDNYGNVMQYQIFDYNSSTTPIRTYTNVWAHSPSNGGYVYSIYDLRYLRNLLTSTTVADNGGHSATLVMNTYDSGTLTNVSGAREWDSTLGGLYSGYQSYRGNITSSVTPSGTSRYAYDATGHLLTNGDATGACSTVSYSTATNFAVPDSAAPMAGTADLTNGHSSTQAQSGTLAAGYTYDAALNTLATSLPNAAVATQSISQTTGLVQSSVSVHGATTNYAYTFNPTSVTATTNGHWSKVLKDGLGHTVSSQSGTGSAIISETDTVYGPCACSPAGKVTQVSQPYGVSSGTVTTSDGTGQIAWTRYSYDGLGRTLTTTAPDGSATQYVYQGNTVKVTDPAGNWKRYTTDALGNLTQVAEPNPQYGQADSGGTNFLSSYTFDIYGHLTGVSMPRPSGGGSYTQTRTYNYDANTGLLASQTLPENGTTTYTHYPSGRLATMTDAKGQETDYSYDGYGRLEYVDKYIGSSSSGSYDVCSSSQFVWDTNTTGVNGLGRLSAVNFGTGSCQFGTVSDIYQYSAGGLLTYKGMEIATPQPTYYNPTYGYQYPVAIGGVGATYTYDNEGRQTSYSMSGMSGAFNYTLDAMGRATGMAETSTSNPAVQWVQNAAYGPAGEMRGMSYLTSAGGSYQETRTYNNRLQVTAIVASGSGLQGMGLQYSYPAGANNGQVSQVTDILSGEQIVYTYDSLKRLTKAEAVQSAAQYPGAPKWGQSFTYDGWGNMTAKAPTAAGPASQFSVSVDPSTNHITSSGFAYDANGNMTSSPTVPVTLSYDTSNRIAGAIYNRDNQPFYKNGVWYLYEASGRRLATYTMTLNCQWYPNGGGQIELCSYTASQTSRNVYFRGRMIQSNGKTVVVDRLGSVRANESGETFEYYPYGDEITVKNPQDREKFGTYTRDSATGLDYAVNRWHMPGWGRFNTPDPYQASANGANDPNTPLSWNRYSYVTGDPVGQSDRKGLYLDAEECIDNPDACEAEDWDDQGGSSGGNASPTSSKNKRTRPIDEVTDLKVRAGLKSRLSAFSGSNCDRVFGQVIQGYSARDLSSSVSSTEFYNVTNPLFAPLTQDQVSGNGSSTPLGGSLNFGQTAATTSGSLGAVVLLGANFFSNASSIFQGNVALHELLHAYTGWNDQEIFAAFSQYGLQQSAGTQNISSWLSTDCVRTPTSITWWQ